EAFDARRKRGYALPVRSAPATAARTTPPATATRSANTTQPRQRARSPCAARYRTACICSAAPRASARLPRHKTTVRTARRTLQGDTSHMTVCHHHPYTPTHLPEGAGRLVGVAVLQDVCQPAASRSGSVVRPMDLTQYDPSVRGNGGIADSSPDSRPRPGGLSVKGMSYITE